MNPHRLHARAAIAAVIVAAAVSLGLGSNGVATAAISCSGSAKTKKPKKARFKITCQHAPFSEIGYFSIKANRPLASVGHVEGYACERKGPKKFGCSPESDRLLYDVSGVIRVSDEPLCASGNKIKFKAYVFTEEGTAHFKLDGPC